MIAEKTTITINTPLWKRLLQLKIDQNLRTFDEVIDYLLTLIESTKEDKEENGTGHSIRNTSNGIPSYELPRYSN